MSELTKVDRCPKCGKTMAEKFDYTEVNPLVTAATPNGKYSCFWCGYDDEKSSPVPEGPAPIQAQSMSDYRRITLAGKDALPPAQPSPVVAGIPMRTDPTIPKDAILLAGATSIKAVNVGDLAPVVPVGETKQNSRKFIDEYERRFRKNRKRAMQWADIAEMMDEFAALPATEKEN